MKIKYPAHSMQKTSYILVLIVLVFVAAALIAPAVSLSANNCSSCPHNGGVYNQQIDLLEVNSQIPTTLQVGQTATVSIVIQNINNAPRYTQLSNVAVTLSSQNGHFSVNSQTYNLGTLNIGTATATFQVTGTSVGSDQFVIAASARNSHIPTTPFSDSFSSPPSITVTASTQSPTPTAAATPTTTPTSNPTQNPTANPTTPTGTSTPTPTSTVASPTPEASNVATPTPTETPEETTEETPTPTPNTTIPPNTTPTPTPIPSHLDELNSNMIYVHPPLAIVGYVFTFIFAAFAFKSGLAPSKTTRSAALVAWVLTALGLFTGMLWGQIAWGSYWSWDIKETFTLTLFLLLTGAVVAFFERKKQATKWLLVAACILVVATASTSFIVAGLHSFA